MGKFLWIAFLLCGVLLAEESSSAKIVKLSNKGEKIVKTLCESDKLPDATGTIEQLIEKIKNCQACPTLSQSYLEAVAYFVSNGSMHATEKSITVPSGARCPVCGMFVDKYPKWAAMMVIADKQYYFDGVKDMMKYTIFDGDFPYDRTKISLMQVTDFYTLEGILAKDAFYVVGSDIYGPMGNELIPFKIQKAAQNFMNDHKGEKILRFKAVTPEIVMALDGLAYEQE